MKISSIALLLSIVSEISAFTVHYSNTNKNAGLRLTSMELSARKPFITGNWKLNPQTKAEAIELALGIQSSITGKSPCDVGLFVPFPFIDAVQNAVGDKLVVGAEMVSPQDAGAFTGGISCSMLKSIGVDWALAGHSERRTIFAETDDDINAQCLKLIESGMNVVLCIGETLQEFEKDLVGAICEVQLKKALAGISATDMSRVTIAYEPIWAIGTGKVATPEIAQDVHATCRQILVGMYGEQVANDTRILYGGSVSPESVDGLLAKPDIDGALVGGASLESEKFGRIINFEMAEAPMIA
jgi:triosephosphate isomerase